MKWIELLAAIPLGMGKLIWYFQAPGMLSILGWLSALILLAVFYRRRRYRHVVYTVALVLALLGFVFGHLNSTHISRMRTDMTDKLDEARASQEEATKQRVEERRRLGMLDDIQFAEDDKTDIQEREQETDAKKSIYELAAEGKIEQVDERQSELDAGKSEEYERWSARGKQGALPPAEDRSASIPGLNTLPMDDEAALQRFDYRKSGKKARASGRQEKNVVVQQAMKQAEFVGGRLMKAPDVLRAQRFDGINLFFCRNVLWLALLMFIVDYLFRANRTFWTVWPLPVAGRLLDYFHPKQHAVLMERESPAFLKGYLETAVRKGESFLYFGESDPWKGSAVLRLRIPPVPEACLRLWETFLWMVEYAGIHTARGYRALIAGKQRRAAEPAGRASLAVRTGDRILGVIDAGVKRVGPPVWRGATIVGRRLYGGGLALRMAWITAQARYPLRLAPIAMLLFSGHSLVKAVNRFRAKPEASGGSEDRSAGDTAPAHLPLRLALVVKLRFIGHGLVKVFDRFCAKLSVPGEDTDAFLLGRVQPDRIGGRRWWDRGWLGVAARWVDDGYRRYAGEHPRWLEWVERQGARLRRLDAILFREGIGFWITRLRYDRASLPADRLFPFEAVWFNRYCCCIIGQDAVRAALPDLLYFLRNRLVPRAQAWQTVNIVWDMALPLDRETVDELAFRCRESNLRLMIVSRDGWAQAMADLFDEKAAEQINPDDRARIEHMAVLADRMAEQRGWTP